MDERHTEMIAALRAAQTALDWEVRSALEDQLPDWSMLERLRDVADEYAGRARALRQMMIDRDADADLLEEVDQLCKYFDGTAGLIAQRTGDVTNAASPPTGGAAGPGQAKVADA